jgi:hypothetical protein
MKRAGILVGASLFALLAGIGGAVAVILAEHHWYTSRGPVNMLDRHAVDLALADPTLIASMSWGQHTLAGQYWALLLTVGLAFATFFLVLLLGSLVRRARTDPDSFE